MQIRKAAMVLLALFTLSTAAHAGFVDNRGAAGTGDVEATYNNVSVDDLTLSLMPADYSVVYDTPEYKGLRTSISGSGAWGVLLQQALTPIGLIAVVDGSARTVRIGKQSTAVGSTVATSSVSSPATPIAAAWNIRAGEKMGDAFVRWGKQSGKWVVYWEAPGLVSQADINVNGSFEEIISTVIESLNANGAGIMAKYYSNNVVRIVEKQ